MVAKIPIEVDVDQAQFAAFYDAFQKYKAALDDMPGQWGKVSEEAEKATGSAVTLVEQSTLLETALYRASQYSTSLRLASDGASKSWRKIAEYTSSAASHIKDATSALLKWSGIASIIGGLAGGVGMMGMDMMGSHVAGARTGAMRAGTTYGGRESFLINFGRFGDAEGVLGRVAQIMSSADHTALRNLGISEEEIRNGDPADIAAKAFKALREKSQGVNKNYLGDWLHANRIDEVFSLGQALQARSTSKEEEEDIQKNFAENRKVLEMTPKAQLGWTKFVMQLDLAAGIIKKVFAENLSHLTTGLGRLSEAFSKVLGALFKKDGPIAHWLEDLNKWLMRLADDIGRPEFEASIKKMFEGVKTLVEWAGKLLHGLRKVAEFFGITPAAAATSGGGNGAGGAAGDVGGGRGGEGSGNGKDAGGREGSGGGAYAPSSEPGSSLKETVDQSARKYGVDPHVMYGIIAGESAHGSRYDVKDDAIESSWGPFQLNRRSGLGVQFEHDTEAERKRLGLGDLRDPRTIPMQADWVARYLAHGGSLRPWAGYHGNREWSPSWGSAGLQPRQKPSETASKPSETSSNAVSPIPPTWRTKVLVSKPPGGDISASANAAAHVTP